MGEGFPSPFSYLEPEVLAEEEFHYVVLEQVYRSPSLTIFFRLRTAACHCRAPKRAIEFSPRSVSEVIPSKLEGDCHGILKSITRLRPSCFSSRFYRCDSPDPMRGFKLAFAA